MKFWDISCGWPGGVSDGLSLPCKLCGCNTNYDYKVTDTLWHSVVPDHAKRDVVCLDCLDHLTKEHGHTSLSLHLIEIQYTGINETIILKPETGFKHTKHNK